MINSEVKNQKGEKPHVKQKRRKLEKNGNGKRSNPNRHVGERVNVPQKTV